MIGERKVEPSPAVVLGSALAAGLGLAYAARWAQRLSRRMVFRNKVVLITGGSRGLGLEIARRFVVEGAKVAICARDYAELQRAAQDLRRHGAGALLTVTTDVTDAEQVRAMVNQVIDRFGALDVLVNNAGVIGVGPLDVMTMEDYELAMATHFWGPLHAITAALPHLRRAGGRHGARIVNISSIGGKLAAPHLLPYTASKFALTGLSEGLRSELLKDNIHVTTVCPGLMRTGSPRNATFKGRHRDEYAWFVAGDSLPLTSMSASRAANQIVTACRHGEAEVVLSIQAKAAVFFHDLFPGLFSDLNALVNRLLPPPGGIGRARATGAESESKFTQSWITSLTRRAERRNNEIPS